VEARIRAGTADARAVVRLRRTVGPAAVALAGLLLFEPADQRTVMRVGKYEARTAVDRHTAPVHAAGAAWKLDRRARRGVMLLEKERRERPFVVEASVHLEQTATGRGVLG